MARNKLEILAAVAVLSVPSVAEAALIEVGPGDDYSKIEAAAPGDIVEIAPGTYQFRVYLSAQGTEDNPIIIRAQDPDNRPVWDLDGMNVENWPGSYGGGDNGRGCWQVTGSSYQISGIVFQNCHTGSGNAPGIRARGAQDLWVRDVLFFSNDVGFSGDGENLVVEFSEFDQNGRQSNPPQHSIYMFAGSFTLRYSYVHDSIGGQNFHIRSRDSVIEYNWIARAANYEGDMMPGDDPDQTMLFRGNVVVGNPSPDNSGKLITMHSDGGQNLNFDLRIVYNTFVVQSGSNPVIVESNNHLFDSTSVEMSNNIIVGTETAFRLGDPNVQNYTLTGTNNYFPTGADVGPLANTIFGDDPGFVDAGSMDLRLTDQSAAAGAADTAVGGLPDREYFENETNPMMFRWRASANDLGAFERGTMGPGYGPYDDPDEPPSGETGTDTGMDTGDDTGGSGSASATAGSGSAGDTAGEGGTAGEAGSGDAGSSDDGGGGCGCRTSGWPASVWLLGLLSLVVPRRARAR